MIIEIADALEWDEPFVLMAHSRGGAVALITAAAFPKRIKAFIAFDIVYFSFNGPRTRASR